MEKPRKGLSVEHAVAALRQVYAEHFARVEEDARRRHKNARRRLPLEDRSRSRVA